MPVPAIATPAAHVTSARRRIRVTGREKLVDVVRAVFADVRVLPLVRDLNPTLSAVGLLTAGAVVVCPSVEEAQAFARRHGFTLGFDEAASNGTGRRRAWLRLQQGTDAVARPPLDPATLARSQLDEGSGVVDVADRVVRQCDPRAVERFLGAPDDEQLQPVQRAVEFQLCLPRAHARLTTTIAVIDATLRPRGLRCLFEAAARDPAALDAALGALLVPEALRRDVVAAAGRVGGVLARARELARLDRGSRDLALARERDASILVVLVESILEGLETFAGDRLALLEVAATTQACSAHLERLRSVLKAQRENLPRAGHSVVVAVARDDGDASLPRPWPVVVAVVRGVCPLADVAGVAAIDDGVGGLLTPARARAVVPPEAPVRGGGVVVPVAGFQRRAALGARAVDDSAAIADRVAPRLLDLFTMVSPLVVDHGPPTVRRARRRQHFDAMMAGRSAPTKTGIVAAVEEIVREAERRDVGGVHQLTPAQRAVVRDVAAGLVGALPLHHRAASERARALVVVAMAVDNDLGRNLLRTNGPEVFRGLVERHAAHALARACAVFTDAPTAQHRERARVSAAAPRGA
jgi:hypothetical protein